MVALWRLWWSINDKRHKWQILGPEALWPVFIVKKLSRVTVLLYVLQLRRTAELQSWVQQTDDGNRKDLTSDLFPADTCWISLQRYIQYPKWLIISANKSKWGFGSLSLSPEKKDYICFLIATGCERFIFFLSLSSSTSYKKTPFQHPGLTWVRPNCPVRTDSNKIDRQRFLSLLGWPSPRFTDAKDHI